MNEQSAFPRLSEGGKVPLSRGHFLEGKTAVYFGPGQPMSAWPGVGSVPFDSDEFDPDGDSRAETLDYEPPTDWPAAGTLLRVPQVAHLSFNLSMIGDSYQGTDDPKLHGWPGDPFNLYNAEWDRIGPIFDDAKTIVEAVRPGRTWVQVNMLKRLYTRPSDGAHLEYADFRRGNRFVELLAPPSDAPAYFGADLLHVYAGHHARDLPPDLDGFITRFDHYFQSFDGSPGAISIMGHLTDHELASAEYARSRVQMVRAGETFRGHRTKLYRSGDISQPFVGPSNTQFYWYDGVQYGLFDPFKPHAAILVFPWFASRAFAMDDKVTEQVFDRLADDLEDEGVTHDGEASDLSSGEEVARLIADHFRFDLDSGRDL